MDRLAPAAHSDELDLYIRTYYSLLRSSGEVRVRALEESHLYSQSSLHLGSMTPEPDLAAFAYSAARLPACMPQIQRVILGQSLEQFVRAGFDVDRWSVVKSRGRRRPLRWDGGSTLAVFIASASDIDDLVPIVTAYQIEWNKLRSRLGSAEALTIAPEDLAERLATNADGVATLEAALGDKWREVLSHIAAAECDLRLRLLDGSFREYQRSAQRWWREIEPVYFADGQRPIYFVSSNSHSLLNLLGGYVLEHRDQIVAFARRTNLEGLVPHLERAIAAGDEPSLNNMLYYCLRAFLHEPGAGSDRLDGVQAHDAEAGMRTIASPGHIDVDAQIFDLGKLKPERVDPRVRIPGLEKLAASRALIINIDYPLGMAAYHHLSALTTGIDEIRGIYIMGKAATLNGRVGDVMISKTVHDVHSSNTYLFRNVFAAADVQPFMRHGTVLDNQRALSVRSAYLQNRDFMDGFYREGYTVMEMEAGPYLSAVFETSNPQRHPRDEIISLSDALNVDLGVLHYASDTPYSRRQSLLSKSLSFFGVESTYSCAIAIVRRILKSELERV